jgi:hypothetical protein
MVALLERADARDARMAVVLRRGVERLVERDTARVARRAPIALEPEREARAGVRLGVAEEREAVRDVLLLATAAFLFRSVLAAAGLRQFVNGFHVSVPRIAAA